MHAGIGAAFLTLVAPVALLTLVFLASCSDDGVAHPVPVDASADAHKDADTEAAKDDAAEPTDGGKDAAPRDAHANDVAARRD